MNDNNNPIQLALATFGLAQEVAMRSLSQILPLYINSKDDLENIEPIRKAVEKSITVGMVFAKISSDFKQIAAPISGVPNVGHDQLIEYAEALSNEIERMQAMNDESEK